MEMESETDDSPSIPHDIITEILSRLPVKSLCRFLCVSVLWNCTISDLSFTKSHYHHSLSRSDGTSLILTIPDRKGLARSIYAVDHREHDNAVAVNMFTIPGYVDEYVSESLNGLICLRIDFSLKICNPSTREVITLPERKTETRAPPSYSSDRMKFFFGFDPMNNEHKVLSLSVMRQNEDIGNDLIMENKVFVIGDFTWRRISDGPPHYPPSYPQNDGVCVDGVLYYQAWTRIDTGNARVQVVIAFDVALETFRCIQMPSGELRLYENSGLTKYDDRVAIINYHYLKNFDGIEIWVLEGDSDKSNWIHKNIVFSYIGTDIVDYSDFYVAGTLRNGEVILVTFRLNKPFYVFYLNLKNASARRVEVHGLPDYKFLFCDKVRVITATDHVESIVPLYYLDGY